jgi:hypothetical protein
MDSVRYREIAFAPLRREDIPVIFAWLQQPHVLEFYCKKPAVWEETRTHYLQRLDPASPTKCFLVRSDRPFGYIQTYRIADYSLTASMLGETNGIGIDLFIGDPEYLATRWGRNMLLKFLNEIAFPLFPEENVCWIYHEAAKHRAMRASKAVGFQ